MSFPEDQHLVGEFGADGQHEAFGEAVRPRSPRWDLDHLDTRIREYRVERGRELPGSIPDQEPEPGDVFVEAVQATGRPSSCAVATANTMPACGR
jgi:hypothetical protein